MQTAAGQRQRGFHASCSSVNSATRPQMNHHAPVWHTFCNLAGKLRFGALHKNNEKVSLMDNATSLPTGAAVAPAAERTTASRLKSIFSGSIGNMVEWYD